MKINTIEEIKKVGIDEFVSKYNLRKKDYGHKFSLKYDQLNTPKNEFTNECRGIVLSKDLELLSLPFIRFGNYNENTRSHIDWETATYWEKTDGTLIHYYFDTIDNDWKVGTTGTGEAIDLVTSYNKITKERKDYDFNLTDLFYKTCKTLDIKLTECIAGCTYIFELATKENIVINSYKKDTVKLLGIRSLEEKNGYEEFGNTFLGNFAELINCERPIEYFFDSEYDMIESLNNVKYGDVNFEGYVIVDESMNRLKVKSNTYLVYSQFNGESPNLDSAWRLVDVVLNNEIEEVTSNFPNLKATLDKMDSKYKDILSLITDTFNSLKERNLTSPIDNKEFFIEGNKALGNDKNKKALMIIFSSLKKNKDITLHEAVLNINKKGLFKLLK